MASPVQQQGVRRQRWMVRPLVCSDCLNSITGPAVEIDRTHEAVIRDDYEPMGPYHKSCAERLVVGMNGGN